MSLMSMRRILAAAAMALAAVAATAVPATQAGAHPEDEKIGVDYKIVHNGSLINFGGRYFSDYAEQHNLFPDQTLQVYVIGTDYAVWTRWRTINGVMSDWRSLGGKIRSHDTRSIGFVGTQAVPKLRVIGTDENKWCNERRLSGSWTGWIRCD